MTMEMHNFVEQCKSCNPRAEPERTAELLRTVECCGLKFQIHEDEFEIILLDGTSKKLTNGRQAVIFFSEEVASYIMRKLFPIIEGYGYDKYTGEKKRSEKA